VYAPFDLILFSLSSPLPRCDKVEGYRLRYVRVPRVCQLPSDPEKRNASTPDDIIDRYLDIASSSYLHLLLPS